MNLNRPIRVVLVSESRLLLEGVYRVLRYEINIKIVAETSRSKEIEKYLIIIKPDILFIDSRTVKPNIHCLLNLIDEKSPHTKVILYDNDTENEFNSPNVINIPEENSPSELIHIIKTTQAT